MIAHMSKSSEPFFFMHQIPTSQLEGGVFTHYGIKAGLKHKSRVAGIPVSPHDPACSAYYSYWEVFPLFLETTSFPSSARAVLRTRDSNQPASLFITNWKVVLLRVADYQSYDRIHSPDSPKPPASAEELSNWPSLPVALPHAVHPAAVSKILSQSPGFHAFGPRS
ncbi:hypothetical protein ONS96_003149 [Cadophora gregata f. sp. sojae]|nr:hypothetical protein ONS96_003149 [Cadophora gregata f. sp. sojae]